MVWAGTWPATRNNKKGNNDDIVHMWAQTPDVEKGNQWEIWKNGGRREPGPPAKNQGARRPGTKEREEEM